jgi:acetylornithine deacetylase
MLRLLLFLGKEPLFDRECSEIVYSIREMISSRAGFVVPDRCEAWIDLHLPPGMEPAALQEAIRRITAEGTRSIPGLEVEVNFDFASPGCDLGIDNLPARIVSNVYHMLGLQPKQEPFRSHSDGNLLCAAGSKPIILGPGSLETAHTPDEQVILAEVVTAARIYAALCLKMNRAREEILATW